MFMYTTPTKQSISQLAAEALKIKTKALFAQYGNNLPRTWVTLFTHDFPEFKGREKDLYNYKAGYSTPPHDFYKKLQRWIKKTAAK
ncbi:MAG: hypothetical protein KF900_14140 [Bacteroidetes bacterium]|nr:hypothetical protein [Bacteroidota bacterium]